MKIDPLDARLDLNLRVKDLENSTAWYGRIFGADPIYRGVDRSLDGNETPMVCFRLGGVKIWLLPRSDSTGRESDHCEQRVGIALMTRQPLAPLRAELAARGARFDDTPMRGFPIDAQGIRIGKDSEFFYLLDPDGHRLEFCRVFRVDGSLTGQTTTEPPISPPEHTA